MPTTAKAETLAAALVAFLAEAPKVERRATGQDTDAQGATHEPTRAQEPDGLTEARTFAFNVWKGTLPRNTPNSREDFIAAYEQWKAQPFVDATPVDLQGFAVFLGRAS